MQFAMAGIDFAAAHKARRQQERLIADCGGILCYVCGRCAARCGGSLTAGGARCYNCVRGSPQQKKRG